MQIFLLSCLALIGMASATTLDVVQVFQPLSLHGTDIDHQFEGKHIQTRVFPRPMVLSGAMPESLVVAIAAPHRMPASDNYKIEESNLLVLYKVAVDASLEEESLVVTFDLSNLKAPEGVELPIRVVLRLAIASLKQTLSDYHHAENEPLKVSLVIAGTTEGNASLRDLAVPFVIRD